MAASSRSMKGLECPVCMELMTVPIYNCMSGHSLCNTCTVKLATPQCPICRQEMTQIRNRHLEDLVAEVQVDCRNRPAGCVYKLKPAQLEDHLKECIFRHMDCPLGVIFGKCSWAGNIKDMMNHFKERHAESVALSPEGEITLDDVSAAVDDRRVFFVAIGKCHFILTFKMDTLQKMVYWGAQLIGPKGGARQWLYEVSMSSQQDARRHISFVDYCTSDTVKVDEVFKSSKCAMLPLDALATYIKNKKLTFRFTVKRAGPGKENKPDDDGGNPPGPNEKKPHPKKDFKKGDFKGKPGPSHNGDKKPFKKGP